MSASHRPRVNQYKKRMFAVLVGTRYLSRPDKVDHLLHSHTDVTRMRKRLRDLRCPEENIMILADLEGCVQPTYENILTAFTWLVACAHQNNDKNGCEVFLYYAGHCVPIYYDNRPEEVHQAIVPSDAYIAGIAGLADTKLTSSCMDATRLITDDLIRTQLVQLLPSSCRLMFLPDCCYAAGLLDLPNKYCDKDVPFPLKLPLHSSRTSIGRNGLRSLPTRQASLPTALLSSALRATDALRLAPDDDLISGMASAVKEGRKVFSEIQAAIANTRMAETLSSPVSVNAMLAAIQATAESVNPWTDLPESRSQYSDIRDSSIVADVIVLTPCSPHERGADRHSLARIMDEIFKDRNIGMTLAQSLTLVSERLKDQQQTPMLSSSRPLSDRWHMPLFGHGAWKNILA